MGAIRFRDEHVFAPVRLILPVQALTLAVVLCLLFGLVRDSLAGALSALAPLTTSIVLVLLNRKPRPRELTVDDEHVSVDGEPWLRIDDIAWADSYPMQGQACVRIATRSDRPFGASFHVQSFICRGKHEADALLHAIGADERRFEIVSFADRWVVWSVLAYLTIGVGAMASSAWLGLAWPAIIAFALLCFLVLALVLAQFFFAPRLSIGSDGILVATRTKQQFVSYAEVSDVGVDFEVLVVSLTSGSRRRFAIARPHLAMSAARRIQNAMRACRGKPDVTLTQLERPAGVTIRAWISELRTNEAPQSYRAQSLSPNAVRDALLNSRLRADVRANAAVALRALGDDQATALVRALASTTANPKLRAALEKIAENSDDAAIESHLDAMRA